MHLKAQYAISASQSNQNKRCSSWVQIQTLWRNKHQEPPQILLWSAAVNCGGDLRCRVFIIYNVDSWLELEGKCTSWTKHYKKEREPECLLSAEFSQMLTWNVKSKFISLVVNTRLNCWWKSTWCEAKTFTDWVISFTLRSGIFPLLSESPRSYSNRWSDEMYSALE